MQGGTLALHVLQALPLGWKHDYLRWDCALVCQGPAESTDTIISFADLGFDMSTSLKPITLWAHAQGPNPWKVAIILNELDVPYEPKIPANDDIKKEPYTKLNPNGRVPTIEDPNTGITLWETGAIIPYLVETYDKDGKISYPSGELKWKQLQWLNFQVTGQGSILWPGNMVSSIPR